MPKDMHTTKEKGTARIQQLMEQFPQIPKTLILKIDILREGVRHNTDLDWVGKWACPDGTTAYDLGKDGYHFAPEVAESQRGWIEKPVGFRFGDETPVWLTYCNSSPYEIFYEGYGRYKLYRDGEPVEEVFFIPRAEWYSQRSQIDGKLLCNALSQFDDNYLLLMSPNYCAYFATGDDCFFCPVTRTQKHFDDVAVDTYLTVSIDRFVEAFKAGYTEIKAKQKRRLERKARCGTPGCLCHVQLHMSGGAMYNRHKEARRYERFIVGLKEAMGDLPDVLISVEVQALEAEDAKMLHDVGLHATHYNIECWDKRMFSIACPGKSKFVGWDKWVDCLVRSTEFYDQGHVLCGIVPGLEMLPPHGIQTEEEALNINFQGMEWLCQHGVSPLWTVLCTSPMTTKAQRDCIPSTEYYLKIGWRCHELHQEYHLYGPSRGLYCKG